MTEAVGPPQAEDLVSVGSRVSWGAIFAGALLALALYSLFAVLGAAVGLTVDARVEPAQLRLAAVLWAIVTAGAALFVGGLVASPPHVGARGPPRRRLGRSGAGRRGAAGPDRGVAHAGPGADRRGGGGRRGPPADGRPAGVVHVRRHLDVDAGGRPGGVGRGRSDVSRRRRANPPLARAGGSPSTAPALFGRSAGPRRSAGGIAVAPATAGESHRTGGGAWQGPRSR
jgi:hypothetical protein